MPLKIVRVFAGKEYQLDALLSKKREANYLAKARRADGYRVRVRRMLEGRFGVWICKQDDKSKKGAK